MKSSLHFSDVQFMQEALRHAQKARARVSPNPRVGCVIVKNQKIIATGYHKKFGGPHAEIEALKKIAFRAEGATIYVTLEPCHHFGKTPPCVAAILRSGAKRVVVAMFDPNPLTHGKSVKKLRRHGVAVTVGVCRTEAQAINRGFVKAMCTGLPYVIVKVAQSADGKIAKKKNQRTQLTGKLSQKFVHNLRRCVDAVLVGSQTVRVDDPLLNVRQRGALQPKRVVLDSRLQTKTQAKIFSRPGGDVILCASSSLFSESPKKRVVKKYPPNAHIMLVKTDKTGVLSLSDVLQQLVKKFGVLSVLVEGGGKVFQSFAKTKFVDEWHIATAPLSIGSQGVAAFVNTPDFKNYRKTISRLENDVWVRWVRK